VEHNGWSQREQLAYLKAALVDEAGQVLWDYGPEVTGSLSTLEKLLKERFGGIKRADKFRLELRNRRRKTGETLESLHSDIRRLTVLAHPNLDPKAREVLACDYFVQSIAEPKLVLKIREANPSTLDEALHAALREELWLKEAAGYERVEENQPQRKHVRELTEVQADEKSACIDKFFAQLNRTFDRMQKLQLGAPETVKLGPAKGTNTVVEDDSASKGETVQVDKPHTGGQVSSQPLRRQPRRPIVCWNCGTTGHTSTQCSAPPKNPTQPAANVTRNQGVHARYSETYLPVTVRGHTVTCLLDTGSDVTLTTYDLVRRHRMLIQESDLKEIKAANGSPIIIEGEAVLPLMIAGRRVDTRAYVTKDLTDTILGIDWLRTHDCEWDFVHSRFRLGNTWTNLMSPPERACRRVYVSCDTVLQPQQQTLVPARTTISRPRESPTISIVESGQIKPGVYVGRTLLQPQLHGNKVCVANTSKQPVLLPEDTFLGSVQPATVVDATVEPTEQTVSSEDSVVPKLMDGLPDELTAEQRAAVRNLLRRYEDIFSKNEFDIGRTHLAEYHIDTGSHRPIRQPLRRHPFAHQQAIDENVESMLKAGIVEPAASPWASNVVLVSKKDGSLRFCVDYRPINAITYKDSYPLPRIDNCLDALSGSSWFCTLDLRSGYHNIPVAESDRDKTAFITRKGCWRFTVMPFGLTCAPSVFQRLMDLVLSGLSYEMCLVYLDDIVIFGKTFEEELSRLEQVFNRLRLARLKLKPSKCRLFQRKVGFLGHVVSEAGIEVQSEKVEVVEKWPQPRNLHDVRAFLGLCGYYRRFVADFSNIAAPLYDLTKKNMRFSWGDPQEAAFKKLKELLITAPILAMPTSEGEYILDTDASDIGLGAVLSQSQDGVERVIAYASRTLQKPEKNYETTRKELLAIVFALKHFRQYLLGRPFVTRGDHSALSWLRRTPEPLHPLARWLTLIEQYDYKVVHRPGHKHSNADGLSRRREPDSADECMAITTETTPKHVPNDDTNESPADEAAGHVEPSPEQFGHWNKEQLTVAQQEDIEIGPIVRMRLISEEQPSIETLLTESEATKVYWSQWDRLIAKDGLLYRKQSGKAGKPDSLQLLVPRQLREEGLQLCHTGMTDGHMDIRRTMDQVQRRLYWLTWRGDTARYCRRCPECNSYHRGRLPRSAPLQPIIAGAPFERLSIDLTGPHCKSDRGHIWILTCTDPYTKWVEAFPLRNKEAETVAKVLVEQVICRFGCPISMLSDRGKEVDGKIMTEVCKLLNIDKLRTTSYKPSTNAAIERFHRTLNAMLGKVISSHQRDWDTHLPFVMAAYRASCHETTGYSPNYLTFGRENRMPFDLIYPRPDEEQSESYDAYVTRMDEKLREAYRLVSEHLGHAALRNKKYYDLRVKPLRFNVGDWVYYYNPRHFKGQQDKWSRKYNGPLLVTKVFPPVNVQLQRTKNSKPFVTHIDKVKPFYGDTPKSWLETETTQQNSKSDETVDVAAPTEQQKVIATPNVVSQPPRTSKRQTQQKLPEQHVYDADETAMARPKRQIHMPARYRD